MGVGAASQPSVTNFLWQCLYHSDMTGLLIIFTVAADVLRLAVLSHLRVSGSVDDELQKAGLDRKPHSAEWACLTVTQCGVYTGGILRGLWEEAAASSLVSFFLLCMNLLFGWIGYLGNSCRVKIDWLLGECSHGPLQKAKTCRVKQKLVNAWAFA